MRSRSITRRWMQVVLSLIGLLFSCAPGHSAQDATRSSSPGWIFACSPQNDLYVVLSASLSAKPPRFDSPAEAIARAPGDSALLILADGYPEKLTPVSSALFEEASRKNVRLYIEYPSFLPGITIPTPATIQYERAVISSDLFGEPLKKLRILAIHDCHFLPLRADSPHIVLARVAGFDTAVYGLPAQTFPLLFQIPNPSALIATTKLSHFITGRYAPADAWQNIWATILHQLQPQRPRPALAWTPSVRPTYGRTDKLPADIETRALRRGVDWYFNSRMLVSPAMMPRYNLPANTERPTADWPHGHRIADAPPPNQDIGEGSLGILEGFDARIFHTGHQPVRWWRRNDCNAETAGSLALAATVLNDPKLAKTAANIADWLYFRSSAALGDHADPQSPAYGLIGWNDVPNYYGKMDGFGVYYADDSARSMLGIMLASASLKTDRYDQRLSRCLLANFHLTNRLGFQPDRIDTAPLYANGWQHYYNSRSVSLSPHYQATLWSCYLIAYQQTRFRPFLDRARSAIAMTMAAYPDRWTWANGIQIERAKMILPLAWLVRVEDTPEHRAWLKRMAADMLAVQDSSGAIAEQLGPPGKGAMPPPPSNEAYGTGETSLIQANGDPAADLLYTVNFALLSLHEAAAATGDAYYSDAENKLARFLCRVQVSSDAHPELDGAWFRAFDFRRWEYWASNADIGWGAWSIETGWTQSWLTTVLALRQSRTSLWDALSRSTFASAFDLERKAMLPKEE